MKNETHDVEVNIQPALENCHDILQQHHIRLRTSVNLSVNIKGVIQSDKSATQGDITKSSPRRKSNVLYEYLSGNLCVTWIGTW